MREAIAWAGVIIMLCVIFWPRPELSGDPGRLERANDSLRAVNEGRDMREQLMHEAADSMRQRLDSMVNNAPTAQVRYLRYYGTVRDWSTDTVWRFLSTMPTDTGSTGYADPLGHH